MEIHRASYEEIQSLLKDLQEDLLFTLMASDKELFHSNVIGRIFSKNARVKEEFFKKYSTKDELQEKSVVMREYKHIDLFLQHPGFNSLAIENKLFSDLGDNQLDRYSESLKSLKSDWHGLILTLKTLHMGHLSDVIRKKWKIITYGEFANFLRDQIDSIVGDEFEKQFIFRYIKLIQRLDQLTSLLVPSLNDTRLELSEDVSGNIQTSINKMRYRLIAEEIRIACHRNLGSADFKVGYGISHSRPFLEVEFKLKDGNNLGWQYQEGQFRLFARCNNLTGKGKHDARTKFALLNYPDWFDFGGLSLFSTSDFLIRPADPLKLLKFDPNFVYKYAKTSELSMGDLIDISKILSVRAEHR